MIWPFLNQTKTWIFKSNDFFQIVFKQNHHILGNILDLEDDLLWLKWDDLVQIIFEFLYTCSAQSSKIRKRFSIACCACAWSQNGTCKVNSFFSILGSYVNLIVQEIVSIFVTCTIFSNIRAGGVRKLCHRSVKIHQMI